jgi:hypothetical protein
MSLGSGTDPHLLGAGRFGSLGFSLGFGLAAWALRLATSRSDGGVSLTVKGSGTTLASMAARSASLDDLWAAVGMMAEAPKDLFSAFDRLPMTPSLGMAPE